MQGAKPPHYPPLNFVAFLHFWINFRCTDPILLASKRVFSDAGAERVRVRGSFGKRVSEQQHVLGCWQRGKAESKRRQGRAVMFEKGNVLEGEGGGKNAREGRGP